MIDDRIGEECKWGVMCEYLLLFFFLKRRIKKLPMFFDGVFLQNISHILVRSHSLDLELY